MAPAKWTSKTLPKLPKRPEGVSQNVYADAWFARSTALGNLEMAEAAEREAATLRKEADAAAKHYADLLEQVNGQLTIEDVT